VGSVLRLYGQAVVTGVTTQQPEVLLGSVTVGITGKWEIQSPELADGRYALSAKMLLRNGTEQRISGARELTIDTLRPTLTIDGIYDGVAYELEGTDKELTKTFSGTVSDADTGLAVNFVQNQTSQALSASTGIVGGTVKLKGQSFVEETLTFKAIDRAGNGQELSYRAMLIKLDDLTDKSVLLPDAPTGLDDRIVPPNTGGNYVPTDVGGGQIYIGQGGAWGYSGGGGTGGSYNWQPSNGGTGASGSDPLLPMNGAGLEDSLVYLDALQQILTTARDVLSKHPKTAAKKEALRQEFEMLMEMGRFVEAKNLYSAMEPMLYGALSYEGGMTRRAAILKGWNLAKSLAKDAVLTKVKIAHTNLFGVSLVAMKNNNMTVDRGQLQTVTENLVKDYARLKPASHFDHDDYESSYGYRGANFLDAVWRMGANAVAYRARYRFETEIGEKKVVQFAINDLTEMSKGSIDLLEALKVSSRMLQVAPRVSQLSQDSHGYQYGVRIANYTYYEWGTKQGSLRTASFLDKLMDFGFEIARSNPTIATGLNSSAEWVDTLWEGKTTWTNKEKESVAIGMSEWMDGFRTKPATPNDVAYGWSSYWGTVRNNRALSEKAFDYAGRLMQAAGAIDDVNLKPEVQKADFLSHLVNLSGSYASLNPSSLTTGIGSLDPGDFLDTAWRENDAQETVVEMKQFFGNFKQPNSLSKVTGFGAKIFRALGYVPTLKSNLTDYSLNAAVFVLGGHYTGVFDSIGGSLKLPGFFANVWRAQTNKDIESVGAQLQSFIGLGNQQTQNITNILLDKSVSAIYPIGQNNVRASIHLHSISGQPVPVTPPQPVEADKWQNASTPWPALPAGFQFSANVVKSKKALVIDPYGQGGSLGGLHHLPQSKLEADQATSRLSASGFLVDRLSNFKIQDLITRDLGSYGVIFFATHGVVYVDGDFKNSSSMMSNTALGQPVLMANESIDIQAILRYKSELLNLSLAVYNESKVPEFCVTPNFIATHAQSKSNSIVYLGSCNSTYNSSLVNAFHSIGAGAVFGYTDVVDDNWAMRHGTALINALSTGRTVTNLPFVNSTDPNTNNVRFLRSVDGANSNLALVGKP
jgi:hypothetical protein